MAAATAYWGGPAAPASDPIAAIGLINQTIGQQSALLAYIDVFREIGIVALLMAPLALVLLRSPARHDTPSALTGR
jgi:hypothetical protein